MQPQSLQPMQLQASAMQAMVMKAAHAVGSEVEAEAVLYRDGKTRLASETSSAVMDGLHEARDGLWYIGIWI